MVSIRELYKRYGRIVALDGVALEVASGEIAGLLGPNGAGKTTLISILAGILRPDSGTVLVDGVDVLNNPRLVRHTSGFAPQDTAVYPVVSVYDNLRFFAELAGFRGAALRERVDAVATTLDLLPFLDRVVKTLSGGERRRLHTAIAMLPRARLLLLDEPTLAADVSTRAAILGHVKALARDGAAIVYSTHYLAELEDLAATVTILDQGRVLVCGSVDALIADYGGSVLELTFAGEAPELIADGQPIERRGPVLRVRTERPAVTSVSLLRQLGEEAERLRSIEILRPSLESVYLSLTGRRFAAGEAETGH